MASIVDESRTEMILVGDSLGNVVMGVGSTVPVSLDIIIHHARYVMRSARREIGRASCRERV